MKAREATTSREGANDRPGQPERREPERRSQPRMPFDNSALRRIPGPAEDDPPYQNWWVLNETGRR